MIYDEPNPADYDSYAAYEHDYDLWQGAVDCECEEYIESKRGIL